MSKEKNRPLWSIWAKALGQKSGKNDREADYVAIIRSLIFITYLVTNCFIIAGVIRHWNDEQPIYIHINGENQTPNLNI